MAKISKEITLSNGKKVISQENLIHDKVELSNEFDNSFEESQFDYYNTVVKDSLYYSYLKGQYNETIFKKLIRDTYLRNYKQLIKIFMQSSNESIFLKKVPEGSVMFSGLNYHESFNAFQLLNIQKIKEDLLKYLNDNVCDVVNTQPDPYMHPLKMQLIKNNIKVSMKIHAIDILLRNTLLISVFNPKSFTKLDNSFASYCFETYIDKIKRIDINTYNRLILRFSNDLHKQLENGKSFRDPITTKKIEFVYPLPKLNVVNPPTITTTPLTEESPIVSENGEILTPVTVSITSEAIENSKKIQKIIEENTLKFMKISFNQEFINVCNTFYDFFSKNVAESSEENSDKIKLSNLYEPLSYVFDKLQTYDKQEDVKDLCFLYGDDSTNGIFTLSLVTDVVLPVATSTISPEDLGGIFTRETTTTGGALPISIETSRTINSIKYFTFFSISSSPYENYSSLSEEEKNRVKRETLDSLKRTMRADARLSSLFNYVLPTTKILNIASLYTIAVMTKNNQKLSIAFDTPTKISLDTDKILNNTCDLFNLDFDFNAELLKQLAYLPIELIKALAETYDPNIFISNILRNAAESVGTPPLSILPYSLPFTVYGLPPTNPLGLAYCVIDAGETALYYMKNGFPGYEVVAQDMDLNYKNPFDFSKCDENQ